MELKQRNVVRLVFLENSSGVKVLGRQFESIKSSRTYTLQPGNPSCRSLSFKTTYDWELKASSRC